MADAAVFTVNCDYAYSPESLNFDRWAEDSLNFGFVRSNFFVNRLAIALLSS